MDIDDQAIGIGQQKGRVIGDVIDLKHHAHHALLKLGDAHPAQEAVGDLKGFADQRGSQLGVVQVKEDAVGIGDAPASYFTSCSKIDGDAGVVGGGPVTDSGDQRQRCCAAHRLRPRAALPPASSTPERGFLRLRRQRVGLRGLVLACEGFCLLCAC